MLTRRRKPSFTGGIHTERSRQLLRNADIR